MSQHSMRRGTTGKRRRSCRSRSRSCTSSLWRRFSAKRVARVVVGHREQVDPVAAPGDRERDLVARALGEPLGDALDALGLARQDDLVGHEDERSVARLPSASSRASAP